MSQFSLKPDQKDGGKDENTAWAIVFAILGLVVLAVLFYLGSTKFSGWDIVGTVLFVGGLAWMVGLGEKFYSVYAGRNIAIGGAALILGAVLIFLA
jgi:uncharacterized membrane protein YphA (DoxX/SURF4 family)